VEAVEESEGPGVGVCIRAQKEEVAGPESSGIE